MRYRDTISKLSFALVFIYLVFDIKLGGIFKYFDSSSFKLLASFIFIYFGFSTKNNSDLNIFPTSIVSVIFGIFGKQFNTESGYDFYYFSPSRISSQLEFSSIISGILGFKLLINSYFVDFFWYVKTVSVTGISESICFIVIFLDFYIYFQVFAKLRIHDFLYQVYHLQNVGGAWASMYICQIQSIGYVLSLVIYVIEFLESISQEFLDIILYFYSFIYNSFKVFFVTQKKLQLCAYNIKLDIHLKISKIKILINKINYLLNFYKPKLFINFNINNFSREKINNLETDCASAVKDIKVQKYCNMNLLDFNFLIIKFFKNKIFNNFIKFTEFKVPVFNDILDMTKKYLVSSNSMTVLRC